MKHAAHGPGQSAWLMIWETSSALMKQNDTIKFNSQKKVSVGDCLVVGESNGQERQYVIDEISEERPSSIKDLIYYTAKRTIKTVMS